MARRTALQLTTILLAALTAASLLTAVRTVRMPEPVVLTRASESDDRSPVLLFYEAVNIGIASGDLALLDAVLDADYTEQAATGAVRGGRDALERAIQSLHQAAPGIRLHADLVVAEPERAMTIVRVEGASQVGFVGLSLLGPLVWSHVDAFRLAGGRIVERLGTGAAHVSFEERGAVPIDPTALGQQVRAVYRIDLPAATWRWAPAIAGSRLLFVERGTVAVEVGASRPLEPHPTTPRYEAGSFVTVPYLQGYDLSNFDTEPATVIELIFASPFQASATYPAAAQHPGSEGVQGEVLADGQVMNVSGGMLAVGQATFSAATLDWAESAGFVLLIVETGAIELHLTSDHDVVPTPSTQRERGQSTAGERFSLLAGASMVIDPATAVELRATGGVPAEVLLLTLIPGEGTAAVTTSTVQPLLTATPCDPTGAGAPRFGCTGNAR